MDRTVIVIPARMGATRFPGKPLVDLMGKPMVQWVYEAAKASGCAHEVVVAAPDQEILDAVASFGGKAILTRHDHQSGTDRIAEVAEKMPADIYLNVQGDEPLVRSEVIRACADAIIGQPEVHLASVCGECAEDEYENPAIVKVVMDQKGDSLYFSRSVIPFARNERRQPVWRHYGIYAYRRTPLMAFSEWPMSDLEAAESLEQLRFLEHGYRFRMAKVTPSNEDIAIDLPEHAEAVRAVLTARG